MKKLYEKNELTFAIVWIVIYCFFQSLANSLSEKIGITYSANAAFCIIQAAILFVFLQKNGLLKQYGLCHPSVSAGHFLYYVPLAVLATSGLWNGVAVNDSLAGIVCHVVCMLCVGFIEEMIFRGLLFKAMAKNNIRSAIIVSSLTFGIGHVVNLFNGSGMDFVNNVCQIVFAVAVGFLFVMIFHRGASLIPCIATHSAINSINAFSNDAGTTATTGVIHCLILTAVTAAYTLILLRTLPERE